MTTKELKKLSVGDLVYYQGHQWRVGELLTRQRATSTVQRILLALNDPKTGKLRYRAIPAMMVRPLSRPPQWIA